MKRLLITALLLSVPLFSLWAQNDSAKILSPNPDVATVPKPTGNKPYFGNSLDGMIFSTALLDNNGTKSAGTLRFSMFFHIGATYNYNFNDHVGIYTGLDLKNIGYIEKFKLDDLTVKRRVYTIGVPVGLRFGDLKKRNYVFLGGGIDLAFHYKEKAWSEHLSKQKMNEWFSKRTELLMPYVFIGYAHRGTTIKIQYYPTSFLNQDWSVTNPLGGSMKLYEGNNVNLLLFSVGRDIKFAKK